MVSPFVGYVRILAPHMVAAVAALRAYFALLAENTDLTVALAFELAALLEERQHIFTYLLHGKT